MNNALLEDLIDERLKAWLGGGAHEQTRFVKLLAQEIIDLAEEASFIDEY